MTKDLDVTVAVASVSTFKCLYCSKIAQAALQIHIVDTRPWNPYLDAVSEEVQLTVFN